MLVGKQVLRLKHAAPSKMAFADSPNATMMQGQRWIGRKNVGDEVVVEQIARAVPRKTKDDFTRLSPVAPDWTRPIRPEGDDQRYANCARPMDAVVMYLEDLKLPATPDLIIKGVLAGGFRGAAPGTSMIIDRSIKNILTGTGQRAKKIKQQIKNCLWI
jgi:hypothetical protein